MEKISMMTPSWLAATRLAAQVKLRQEKAFRPEAFHGTTLVSAYAPATAYAPVHVDRPVGGEMTIHTSNGGVQGPYHAWREPVIT
ncbi:hypothetical protein [Acrocarpospora phusangensis]|uniref:hypothetical protein n=1 Tax=Acrocarpospora phusangensis TaxID=1070424 RepID=UPI0019507833|nr:hypothetical protein [Acrocarpospora phusangensis]